jgi:hypothetical protein
MTRLLHYAIFGLLALFVWAILMPKSEAATVWTQQAGYFNWYKVGTANRYLVTTELEVPETWAKQEGTYVQCKSAGGANKYWQQGYDCYGKQIASVQSCDAFVCADDFGWTFDMTKNTVLTCPMVKITKGQAQIYDGLQSIDGHPKCR